MQTVFLSSAFVELESYREVAFRAIDRLGHRCVRMETFPAADREASEFCRAKVKESDVVVLVLGKLYGTPIPGRDISYTEDEFDAAVAAGTPILAFEPAPTLRNTNLEAGLEALERNGLVYEEQKARQTRFIRKVRQGRMVRSFKSEEDLQVQVVHSLVEMSSGRAGRRGDEARPATYAGERLPHLCDRSRQLDEFGESFQAGRPGHPEIYVVCGHEEEQPKHCVERLLCRHIIYPKRSSSTPILGPPDDHALVEWPIEDDDEEDIRFNRLSRRLFQALNPSYTFPNGYSARAFCDLALDSGLPYLRFRHVVRPARWNAAAASLFLARYVPFWREVRNAFAEHFPERTAPRILVFFEVKHRLADGADAAFHTALSALAARASAASEIVCRVLAPLASVEMEDLDDWYDRYERLLLAEYRNRSPADLFPPTPLRMAHVEQRIREMAGL